MCYYQKSVLISVEITQHGFLYLQIYYKLTPYICKWYTLYHPLFWRFAYILIDSVITIFTFIMKVLLYVFAKTDLLNIFYNYRSNYRSNAENLLKDKIVWWLKLIYNFYHTEINIVKIFNTFMYLRLHYNYIYVLIRMQNHLLHVFWSL